MSINVIFTAENRKYMHVGFAINVIHSAKKRKYMHIELTTCSYILSIYLSINYLSTYSRGQKKRHPLKMDILFSLGLNHSAYVKNEQNPPYNDL